MNCDWLHIERAYNGYIVNFEREDGEPVTLLFATFAEFVFFLCDRPTIEPPVQ